MPTSILIYPQTFSTRRTKFQNLNASRHVLQLSLTNRLKQGVKSRMRHTWSSADRRCSNFIWVIKKFIAHKGATYIRGLAVYAQWNKPIRRYFMVSSVKHTYAKIEIKVQGFYWRERDVIDRTLPPALEILQFSVKRVMHNLSGNMTT